MINKILMVVFLFLSNNLKAHDFLTDILVYSEDYMLSGYTVVTSYDLSERDLLSFQHVSRVNYDMNLLVNRSNTGSQEEYRRVGSTDCDFQNNTANKTCGVFDHFSIARAAAIDICHSYAVSNLMRVNLIPQFIAPNTFIIGSSSSSQHHELYDLSQGLKFNCLQVIKRVPAEPVSFDKNNK